VHPDKNQGDSRAFEAFHTLEHAYRTLLDPEKRKVYQRIMREARERTEVERKTENKRRKKIGKQYLYINYEKEGHMLYIIVKKKTFRITRASR
jgi:DnaJ-class molecular chaperone